MFLLHRQLHIPLDSASADELAWLDRVYPRLPISDEGKKKCFKIYFNEDMPSRKWKIQLVNYSRIWKTLF